MRPKRKPATSVWNTIPLKITALRWVYDQEPVHVLATIDLGGLEIDNVRVYSTDRSSWPGPPVFDGVETVRFPPELSIRLLEELLPLVGGGGMSPLAPARRTA